MIVVGEPNRWTEPGQRTVGADRSQLRRLCGEMLKDIGSPLHAPFTRCLVDNTRLVPPVKLAPVKEDVARLEPGYGYRRQGPAAPRACAPGGRVQLP